MVIDYKDELHELMKRNDLTEEEIANRDKLMEWYRNAYIKNREDEYEED